VVPQGRAAQVDPIKPTLKAPGTKRLTLKCDDPLSSFGFNVNLRRYNKAAAQGHTTAQVNIALLFTKGRASSFLLCSNPKAR